MFYARVVAAIFAHCIILFGYRLYESKLPLA
jgi:hypothetical protein